MHVVVALNQGNYIVVKTIFSLFVYIAIAKRVNIYLHVI